VPRKRIEPRVKAGQNKEAVAARRKAFAEAYIVNGNNATQAAITAGFSPKTAYSQGQRLLKNVELKQAIAVRSEAIAKIVGLETERTKLEVARLAYFDPRKLYREDGSFKDPKEWDDDTAAVVASLDVSEEFAADGSKTGFLKKLKLWDKNAALEKAMKFHGLYKEDNAQSRGEPVHINLIFE